MTQKLKTIIFATALAALAACSDDVATERYSVGEEDNLVRLSTGVQSAPSTALPSRADVSGATHYALQTSTAANPNSRNPEKRIPQGRTVIKTTPARASSTAAAPCMFSRFVILPLPR